MWTDRARGRRAISMAEIALAVLILGIMAVPLLGLLQFGVRGTTQSLRLTQAFHAARSVVDAVESFDYADLGDGNLRAVLTTIEVPDGVSRPEVDPIETMVQPLAGGGELDAKVVTVHVAWEKAEGVEDRGEVVLRALVAKAR